MLHPVPVHRQRPVGYLLSGANKDGACEIEFDWLRFDIGLPVVIGQEVIVESLGVGVGGRGAGQKHMAAGEEQKPKLVNHFLCAAPRGCCCCGGGGGGAFLSLLSYFFSPLLFNLQQAASLK